MAKENKKDFILWIEEDALPASKEILNELKVINLTDKVEELEQRNKVLEEALQPFSKLADAVLADTLKTNESPLYGYNDVVIFVKDLQAVKEASSHNTKS